jgi:hypothetical protein
MLRCLVLVALAMPGAVPAGAPAAEIAGVTVPDQVEVAGQALPLRGVGLLRWHHLVRVHTAALWLPPGAQPLDDVVKRLDLHYLRAFSAADFRAVTEESLRQTSDAATIAALRPLIDRYQALYIDRPADSSYMLTYRPAQGCEMAADGRPLRVIPGREFAHALFAIWLGPTPIDAGLRSQLLGE